jgi:hypothetical protein
VSKNQLEKIATAITCCESLYRLVLRHECDKRQEERESDVFFQDFTKTTTQIIFKVTSLSPSDNKLDNKEEAINLNRVLCNFEFLIQGV